MASPVLIVDSVQVKQHQICVPNNQEDPDDCTKHAHVPGPWDADVTVKLIGLGELTKESVGSLVGQVFICAGLEGS